MSPLNKKHGASISRRFIYFALTFISAIYLLDIIAAISYPVKDEKAYDITVMLDEDDMLQHALKLYKHNFDKGVEKSAEDPANFDEKFEKFSMEHASLMNNMKELCDNWRRSATANGKKDRAQDEQAYTLLCD